MMYNTLKIGIYGMIEGKRQVTKKKREDDEESYSEDEAVGDYKMPGLGKSGTSVSSNSRMQTAEERIRELEKLNAELQKKLKEESGKTKKSRMCTIF